MQIFVKDLAGKTITVAAQPCMTVNEVKLAVTKRVGIPSREQRLIYAGKQLADSSSLFDYNIQNEATLHLVLHLPGGNSVSLDIVKRYAPVIQFHPNEQSFPCSIEYLLEEATLNYRNFTLVATVGNQQSAGRPSITYFKDQLFMIYVDSKTSQLVLTSSRNGSDWDTPRNMQWSPKPSLPALAVFLDQLWIIFSESKTSQLWVAHSNDGQAFFPPQQIFNQRGSAPVVSAYEGNLFVVYCDPKSPQIWASQSSDGLNWSNIHKIDGQQGKPALAVFNNKLVMVYTNPRNSQLCVSQYTTAAGWTAPSKISDKGPDAPVLAVFDSWLCMAYSAKNSSELWVTRSRDATTWQDTIKVLDKKGSDPALSAISGACVMVYRDSKGSQLLVTRSHGADFSQHPPISNVTQTILQQNSSEQFYVSVNPSQHTGQPLPTAPLYYSVQEYEDAVEITYIVLYAYQGGQTARARRLASEFNCLLPNLGTHQGDLERITMSLNKGANNTYTIARVVYEAHGHATTYTPDQVKWEDTTHAIVHPTLSSHGMRNMDPAASDHEYDVNIPGFVAIGDWVGTGSWWRPHSEGSDFKLLGLDSASHPIGDQVWAAFRGYLGETHDNTLVGGTYFDRRQLSLLDWIFVKLVYAGGMLIKKIPLDKLVGDGPTGPAARGWAYPVNGRLFQ